MDTEEKLPEKLIEKLLNTYRLLWTFADKLKKKKCYQLTYLFT